MAMYAYRLLYDVKGVFVSLLSCSMALNLFMV